MDESFFYLTQINVILILFTVKLLIDLIIKSINL